MASDIGDREPQAALPDRADSTLGAKSAGVEALAERVGDLDASIILTGVQVFGEYDVALAGLADVDTAAEEFTHLATTQGGCSSERFVFDRDAAHAR